MRGLDSATFRNIARRILESAGYEIPHRVVRAERTSDGLSHARIAPYSTYAPWLDDADFNAAYARIIDNTLVDKYRCFELWQLVGEANKLGGDLLEVGVWRGGTAALMAHRLAAQLPAAKLFACDTFAGVPKAGRMDTRYTGGEHSDTSVAMVRTLLARTRLSNVEILPGMLPEDTGSAVEGRRFSLVHIDVDTYQSAKDVSAWVWPRLLQGGLIVHDDYGTAGCEGITRLVNEERSP